MNDRALLQIALVIHAETGAFAVPFNRPIIALSRGDR